MHGNAAELPVGVTRCKPVSWNTFSEQTPPQHASKLYNNRQKSAHLRHVGRQVLGAVHDCHAHLQQLHKQLHNCKRNEALLIGRRVASSAIHCTASLPKFRQSGRTSLQPHHTLQTETISTRSCVKEVRHCAGAPGESSSLCFLNDADMLPAKDADMLPAKTLVGAS